MPAESGSAVLMTQKGEKRNMTPVFLQDVVPRLAKKLTMRMIMMMMALVIKSESEEYHRTVSVSIS